MQRRCLHFRIGAPVWIMPTTAGTDEKLPGDGNGVHEVAGRSGTWRAAGPPCRCSHELPNKAAFGIRSSAPVTPGALGGLSRLPALPSLPFSPESVPFSAAPTEELVSGMRACSCTFRQSTASRQYSEASLCLQTLPSRGLPGQPVQAVKPAH